MKTFIVIVVGIAVMAVIIGCIISCRSINSYGVGFRNIGTRTIFIPGFKLYDSHDFSEAVCGEISPGQEKGSGSYRKYPKNSLTIDWQEMDTKVAVTQKVVINLPKSFQDYRAEILFYIDSDARTAYVAYGLHEDGKGIHRVVDSDGQPFDISKVKLSNISTNGHADDAKVRP